MVGKNLFPRGFIAPLVTQGHTWNLPSPPMATHPKYHFHVTLLIPLRLLPPACLSHCQPRPYDPTPSFCSPLHLCLRNLSPLQAAAAVSTTATSSSSYTSLREGCCLLRTAISPILRQIQCERGLLHHSSLLVHSHHPSCGLAA